MGKCIKGSIKRLYEKDEDGKIIKIYIERKLIEETLINFNTNHFQKVFESPVYNNKIYNKLEEDYTRDKII